MSGLWSGIAKSQLSYVWHSLWHTDRYPTWKVGINFSIPLDFGMIRDLRRGYRKAKRIFAGVMV